MRIDLRNLTDLMGRIVIVRNPPELPLTESQQPRDTICTSLASAPPWSLTQVEAGTYWEDSSWIIDRPLVIEGIGRSLPKEWNKDLVGTADAHRASWGPWMAVDSTKKPTQPTFGLAADNQTFSPRAHLHRQNHYTDQLLTYLRTYVSKPLVESPTIQCAGLAAIHFRVLAAILSHVGILSNGLDPMLSLLLALSLFNANFLEQS